MRRLLLLPTFVSELLKRLLLSLQPRLCLLLLPRSRMSLQPKCRASPAQARAQALALVLLVQALVHIRSLILLLDHLLDLVLHQDRTVAADLNLDLIQAQDHRKSLVSNLTAVALARPLVPLVDLDLDLLPDLVLVLDHAHRLVPLHLPAAPAPAALALLLEAVVALNPNLDQVLVQEVALRAPAEAEAEAPAPAPAAAAAAAAAVAAVVAVVAVVAASQAVSQTYLTAVKLPLTKQNRPHEQIEQTKKKSVSACVALYLNPLKNQLATYRIRYINFILRPMLYL